MERGFSLCQSLHTTTAAINIRMGSQSGGHCLFVCCLFVCLFVCLLLCCDDLMVTSLLQSEVVFDELERLNEQYQQLNSAFEAQAKELSESQVCTSAHQVPTVQCWWYKRAHGHRHHHHHFGFLTQNEADKLRAEVSQTKKLFFIYCVSPLCFLV